MKEDPLYRSLPDSFQPSTPERVLPPERTSDYSWGLAIAVFFWLGSTTATLWFIVPGIAGVYEQLKVPMPSLTLSVLAFSGAVCRWPWAFCVVGLALSAWSGTWKARVGTFARILVPLVFMVTVATIAFGLLIPLCFT